MWQRRAAWLGGGSFPSAVIYLFAACEYDDDDEEEDDEDDEEEDEADDEDEDEEEEHLSDGRLLWESGGCAVHLWLGWSIHGCKNIW